MPTATGRYVSAAIATFITAVFVSAVTTFGYIYIAGKSVNLNAIAETEQYEVLGATTESEVPLLVVESRESTGTALRFVDVEKYRQQLQKADSGAEVVKVLADFSKIYGFEISYRIPTEMDDYLNGDESAESDAAGLRAFGEVFVDEIGKYPTDFLRENGVDSVILLADPTVSDDRGIFPFGGLAVAEHQTLVLNYTDGQQRLLGSVYYADYLEPNTCKHSDTNIRKGIHHELWHMFDAHNLRYRDKGWSDLNDDNFSYSQPASFAGYEVGYHHCRIVDGNDFTTPYAKVEMLEDRADTFAYLMTTEIYQTHKVVLTGQSGALPGKVKFIQRLMAKWSTAFDAEYYDQINQ